MSKRITDFFGKTPQKKQLKLIRTSSPKNCDLATTKPNKSNVIQHDDLYISLPSTSITSSLNNCDPNITDKNTEWYKGSKLDVNWLLQSFCVLKKVKPGKRSGLQCVLCFEQISNAKTFSRNGQVPIADGIRCDGKKELMRIIDHFAQSDKHPWIKSLKNHESEIVRNLIELAIDVHNDSKVSINIIC